MSRSSTSSRHGSPCIFRVRGGDVGGDVGGGGGGGTGGGGAGGEAAGGAGEEGVECRVRGANVST